MKVWKLAPLKLHFGSQCKGTNTSTAWSKRRHRVVGGRQEGIDRRRRVCRKCIDVWEPEVRGIHYVVAAKLELQVYSFSDLRILVDRSIELHKRGSAQCVAADSRIGIIKLV